MLFLLVLKSNLSEKAFSCVKTKTNSNFAEKLLERIKLSFLLSIWSFWWITFFKHQYSSIYKNELNYLCKHEKRQKQPNFYFNEFLYWMNWVKHSFSLSVSLSIPSVNAGHCGFWPHLQKKSLMENFSFCAVSETDLTV